jgi:hypothetical protein
LSAIIDARCVCAITWSEIDGRRFVAKLRDAAGRLTMR